MITRTMVCSFLIVKQQFSHNKGQTPLLSCWNTGTLRSPHGNVTETTAHVMFSKVKLQMKVLCFFLSRRLGYRKIRPVWRRQIHGCWSGRIVSVGEKALRNWDRPPVPSVLRNTSKLCTLGSRCTTWQPDGHNTWCCEQWVKSFEPLWTTLYFVWQDSFCR